MAKDDPWSKQVTVREAYRAMEAFIWHFWEVGGRSEDQVEFLAAHISSADTGIPIDPALQNEWLEAIENARS